MKLSIIKNLAVAALLSTTLMSGVMASEVTEADLDPSTGAVGKVLAPLLARPEAGALKALVEDALTKHHSLFAKDAATLVKAIQTYEAALQQAADDGDDIISSNMLSMAGLRLADINGLLVGKSLAEIQAENVQKHLSGFHASDLGKHLAAKAKANADAEIKFGTPGTKVSDFLSAKPATLAEAEKLTQAAHDYYDAKAALPRNITEIQKLKLELATASISAADVDSAIGVAGFPAGVVKKLTATDGKARLGEALAELKRQKDQTAGLLKANTAEMDRLRADIETAKLLKASGGGSTGGHTGFTPPPSPKGSPLSSRKTMSSYNAADFDGLPLLTLEEFGGLSGSEKAAFQTAFANLGADRQATYKKMAEPTHTGSVHGSALHFDNERAAQDAHDRGEISLQQLRELTSHHGW